MNTICTTAIGTALLAATFAVPFVPTTARAGDPTAALQRATEYQQQAAVAREQAGRHARLGNVYGRTPIGSGKGLGSHFRALAAHFL